ncbi:MAG: alpha/beta-hydrolase family protein [Tepidisphaeraceae bacterium]
MPKLANIRQTFRSLLVRYCSTFSYLGLVTGTLCFAASLTPSLLPRPFVLQGAVSGVAFAVGYGIGKLIVLAWMFFQIPLPGARVQRVFKWSMALVALIIAVTFLSQTTQWQNSIRLLMDMQPEETAYPLRVSGIALVFAFVVILIARCIQGLWRMVNRRIARFVPPRVSFVVSTLMLAALFVLVLNKVFARMLLDAADRVFLRLDSMIDEDETIPADPMTPGSAASLIAWDTIGRRGKNFIAHGPTRESIETFLGRPAKEPIRVYAGYRSSEDVEERARLAFDELKRVGGFERSVLIVATPTGTGWLDENAVDTVEYLHAGDTAMVTMGYSYLPSWVTLLVDPQRSRASARALFAHVYGYWKTLPRAGRPKLYLHGLSLGSLGAEATTDLFTLIGDPIHGGVFSGPPFPSTQWQQITRERNPGSPSWLPRFQDGSIVRFTARRNALGDFGNHWGPIRFVYIQHASDSMVFFSPDLFHTEPEWLRGQRGPDVSPSLRWYPIVTGLQITFDLATAMNVPLGYGHNYDAGSYIDAWIAVTDPPHWSGDETRRLKQKFSGPSRGPSLASP